MIKQSPSEAQTPSKPDSNTVAAGILKAYGVILAISALIACPFLCLLAFALCYLPGIIYQIAVTPTPHR